MNKEQLQKISFELAQKYGKNFLQELASHLWSEDNFDPDEECGSWSCSHCGACPNGPQEQLLGKKLKQTKIAGVNSEIDEWLWELKCLVCGFVEQKEGPVADEP